MSIIINTIPPYDFTEDYHKPINKTTFDAIFDPSGNISLATAFIDELTDYIRIGNSVSYKLREAIQNAFPSDVAMYKPAITTTQQQMFQSELSKTAETTGTTISIIKDKWNTGGYLYIHITISYTNVPTDTVKNIGCLMNIQMSDTV